MLKYAKLQVTGSHVQPTGKQNARLATARPIRSKLKPAGFGAFVFQRMMTVVIKILLRVLLLTSYFIYAFSRVSRRTKSQAPQKNAKENKKRKNTNITPKRFTLYILSVSKKRNKEF